MDQNTRQRVSKRFDPEKKRTHGEFKDDCDIHLIVQRWKRSKKVTHLRQGEPMWGDFTDGADLATAMERVNEAMLGFDELPADVRLACDNNPAIFLDCLQDPEALEELVNLGLEIGLPEPAESPQSDSNQPADTEPPEPPASPTEGE